MPWFYLFFGKLVLANTAQRALKICGEIFKFRAGSNAGLGQTGGFVVNPATNFTNIFHNQFLRLKCAEQQLRLMGGNRTVTGGGDHLP